MPKQSTVQYTKEGQVINDTVYVCICGGSVIDIGSAGCSHAGEYTYFGQCTKCKNVYTQDYAWQRNDPQKFIDAGWTVVEK